MSWRDAKLGQAHCHRPSSVWRKSAQTRAHTSPKCAARRGVRRTRLCPPSAAQTCPGPCHLRASGPSFSRALRARVSSLGVHDAPIWPPVPASTPRPHPAMVLSHRLRCSSRDRSPDRLLVICADVARFLARQTPASGQGLCAGEPGGRCAGARRALGTADPVLSAGVGARRTARTETSKAGK